MAEPIEIRHLRYFLAVAQTENFTRAAERLNISQPSISQQITQLEGILRTSLFRRVGKRVFLTEAGAAFRARAEIVLRKLDEARDSVNEIGAMLSGRVELGVIPALHVTWIPPVLESIAKDFPGLSVGVHEFASSLAETEVEAGRLDIAFGLISRHSPSIRYEKLLSEPFSLIVANDDNRYKKLKQISLQELDTQRLVLLPERFDMRRSANAIFSDVGVHPRIAFEIDSIDSTLECVRRTGMPTLLPQLVLAGRTSKELRAIPIRERTQKMDFGILWPASAEPNPATVAIGDAIKVFVRGRG